MAAKFESGKVIEKLANMGLLFEINRRVLHPFGMALGQVVEKDGTTKIALFYSDSIEGTTFDDEAFAMGSEKYKKLLSKCGFKHILQARLDELGFIEQQGKVDSLLRKLGKYDG